MSRSAGRRRKASIYRYDTIEKDETDAYWYDVPCQFWR